MVDSLPGRAKKPRRQKNRERRMPLMGHLRELRNRVVIVGAALLIGSAVGWFLYDPVLALLQAPIDEVARSQGRTAELNFAGIASPFDIRLKVSVFIGIFLTLPIWLYQLWAFIVPGLTRTEVRYSLGFLLTALPLFLVGAACAFFALPNAVAALGELIPSGASYIVPAQDYLTFVMLIIVVFGIAFVLPVLMVGLNMLGLLSAATLRRSWRWLVVLVFAFAAVATPSPDAISMFYLVVPMLVMFVLAWAICALGDRRRKARAIAAGTWVEPAVVDDDD
ncbi:twin-arginine translocase subunit TatC [Brevibacterium sp. BRM-1]|uniref:twin-arginine translocase subunit TatC n=1 Tax=Brevibacterium sp. BRM-1 TaxID=2999062 RepID=UPI002E117890